MSVLLKKENALIFEFVYLPVIDLNIRFLYRFRAPVATIWQEGKIPSIIIEGAKYISMEDFAKHTWQSMIKQGGYFEEIPKSEIDSLHKLLNIETIVISQCKISKIKKGLFSRFLNFFSTKRGLYESKII